jgi:hypothetical protein
MGVMKAEIQLIQWKKCFQRGYENRNSVELVEKVFSERLRKQKLSRSYEKSVFIGVMKAEIQSIL